MPYLDLVSRTIDLVGKVIISYMVISVHYRFQKEHKVDENVFLAMRKERYMGLLGIGLMVIAYLIDLYLFSLGS